MKVLHVDTGKEWRGGQRQVFFLHQGLTSLGIESLVAAHPRGHLFQRSAEPKTPLSSRGECDLVAACRLARILGRFSPDIAHAHDAHAHTLLLLATVFNGKPRLVVSRRVDFSITRSPWSRWKYLNPRLDKIITVSQGIKNVLIHDGLPENRISVVHSGVAVTQRPRTTEASLEVRQRLPIPAGAKIVGCVANFAGHKDHRTLLRVFQALAEKERDVYLLLVGDGPLYAEIRAESQKIPCADRIVFTGYQEDVYPYLMNFDVFILTSYLEGLCTSLIDSLVCQVPIVASRTGGIPEVVRDGENGFLVDVGDISGFVAAIGRLLHNPPCYRTFQENCVISAQKFSVENMVAGTVEIYRQIERESRQ
ncbi:MAG: glycosyltransferase [bacterium]